MSSSLSKFGPEGLLLGLTLFVPGTSGAVVNDDTILFVSITQGTHLQQSRMSAPGVGWTAEVPSEGFVNGPAVATGLIVTPVLSPPQGAAPGGFHTFAWASAIELVPELQGTVHE